MKVLNRVETEKSKIEGISNRLTDASVKFKNKNL